MAGDYNCKWSLVAFHRLLVDLEAGRAGALGLAWKLGARAPGDPELWRIGVGVGLVLERLGDSVGGRLDLVGALLEADPGRSLARAALAELERSEAGPWLTTEGLLWATIAGGGEGEALIRRVLDLPPLPRPGDPVQLLSCLGLVHTAEAAAWVVAAFSWGVALDLLEDLELMADRAIFAAFSALERQLGEPWLMGREDAILGLLLGVHYRLAASSGEEGEGNTPLGGALAAARPLLEGGLDALHATVLPALKTRLAGLGPAEAAAVDAQLRLAVRLSGVVSAKPPERRVPQVGEPQPATLTARWNLLIGDDQDLSEPVEDEITASPELEEYGIGGGEATDPGASPPERTLNLALEGGQGELLCQPGDLRVGERGRLRLNVGAAAGWSAALEPVSFPADVSAAIAAEGGATLRIAVTSPDFALEGAEAAPGEWPVLELDLFVPPAADSATLVLPLVARRAGLCWLRVSAWYRNQLVQSARLDALIAEADGAVPPVEVPEGWRELLRAVGVLGQLATVEYTAAPGMVALERLQERAVTLWANETWGTHAIGVRVEGGAPISRALELDPSLVGAAAADLRAILDGVAAKKEVDRRVYALTVEEGPQGVRSRGTPEQLRLALARLARAGSALYAALLPQDLRAALKKPTKEPTTLSVARLARGAVLPWALVYDRPLTLDPREKLEVCLKLLPPEGAPMPSCADCRARPDCPLSSPDEALRERTVCPWGFWGLKHVIEQPPQRRDPGQAARPLADEVVGARRVAMGVYPGFKRLDPHLVRVRGLADPGQFVEAGDDRQPPAGVALAELRRALADRDLTAIYFYCHGGEDAISPSLRLPYLAVGTKEERLYPTELTKTDEDGAVVYDWPRRPLVLMNGCETAAIEPALLGELVDAFAVAGAGGVIGTEIPVFEALAVEVGEALLAAFLQRGERLGEALRALRLDMLRRNNPLGLAYALYAGAELRFRAG